MIHLQKATLRFMNAIYYVVEHTNIKPAMRECRQARLNGSGAHQ